MAWIEGNVTWYCDCFYGECDSGTGGACQDCDDTQNHVAWPRLPATGCYYDCGPNAAKGCGDGIWVYDACTNEELYGEVHDCAPLSLRGCDYVPFCWDQPQDYWRTPLADLTKSFFRRLHGNWTDGRAPVWIWQ